MGKISCSVSKSLPMPGKNGKKVEVWSGAAKWLIRQELIPVSVAWSCQEYFYFPYRGFTPCIKFPGTHLYPWVERDTVREKCLVQEHNTKYLARARTRTARSIHERTNHEATGPPTALPSWQNDSDDLNDGKAFRSWAVAMFSPSPVTLRHSKTEVKCGRIEIPVCNLLSSANCL